MSAATSQPAAEPKHIVFGGKQDNIIVSVPDLPQKGAVIPISEGNIADSTGGQTKKKLMDRQVKITGPKQHPVNDLPSYDYQLVE